MVTIILLLLKKMGIGKKCEKPGQSGQPAEIIEDFSATLKMKGGQSGHNLATTRPQKKGLSAHYVWIPWDRVARLNGKGNPRRTGVKYFDGQSFRRALANRSTNGK